MYFQNKIYILIIFIIASTFGFAQDTINDYDKGIEQQNQYSEQAIKPSNFSKSEWKTLKEKLKIKDYKPKKKKDKKKEDKKKSKKNNLPDFYIPKEWALIIKWLIFGLLLAALLFLVLRVLGINPFNRKIDKNRIHISLEELEDNLDTAAIDPHLYEAIKNRNYKLAIRLYYLMIIQKLALKEKIIWKKYKTNRHYLNELKSKEDFSIFKQLTLVYEKCWFGEGNITEEDYNVLNKDFVNFLQNIK